MSLLRWSRGARRRSVLVGGALAVALIVRGTAPAPQAASGVVDPVTSERIGELTYGIDPARLLDTRPATMMCDANVTPPNKLSNGATFALPVRGRCGVPSTATGVFVNVTVTDPSGAGYASVWPDGGWPGTSTVNFAKGATVANSTFVAIGSDGNIRIRVSDADAHVLVDVVAFSSDLPTIA